jgi:hypothetical protein
MRREHSIGAVNDMLTLHLGEPMLKTETSMSVNSRVRSTPASVEMAAPSECPGVMSGQGIRRVVIGNS